MASAIQVPLAWRQQWDTEASGGSGGFAEKYQKALDALQQEFAVKLALDAAEQAAQGVPAAVTDHPPSTPASGHGAPPLDAKLTQLLALLA